MSLKAKTFKFLTHGKIVVNHFSRKNIQRLITKLGLGRVKTRGEDEDGSSRG